MGSLIWLLGVIVQVVFWLVLVQFIIAILLNFDVLNPRQPVVMQIYRGISQLLDPLLNPIRRVLPATGGLDFSPLVLLIGLQFIQVLLINNFA